MKFSRGIKVKKHYIFDLDGTLITSAEMIAAGVCGFFEKRGVAYPPDVVKIIMPMGYAGFANYAISLGVKGDPDELAKGLADDFYDYYANKIKLKPYAKEYIEKLISEGAHCHVLTGSPHLLADPCLKNNGVYELFDNVWSVDDFGLMKSDKRLYERVCEELSAESTDICFFDDNLNVVKTCREAGIYIVGVYDITAAEYKDEIRALADEYVDSFEQLL